MARIAHVAVSWNAAVGRMHEAHARWQKEKERCAGTMSVDEAHVKGQEIRTSGQL
jgi:hypothetical protein